MAVIIKKLTHDGYVEALCHAADEIKLRADDIIGDISATFSVSVSINIEPHSITDITVTKQMFCCLEQKEANNNC